MKLEKLLKSALSELQKAENNLYNASDLCDEYHNESKLANAAGKIKIVIDYINETIKEA